jgi:hypothetical protein
MKTEAVWAIIDALESGYNGYYCDLHNEVFNTDYYIIGTYQAKEALREYDVFQATELVQTYEKDNFGEVYTDLNNPEKLINMVYYIIGDEVIGEMYSIDAFNVALFTIPFTDCSKAFFFVSSIMFNTIGTAITAMIASITITAKSSIRVNPLFI